MAEGVITTDAVHWRYEAPPDRSAKVLLLTQGGTAIVGTWGSGAGLWGWVPLPKRDKKLEKELGLSWLT